jgi:hypothetical protein
VFTVIEYLFDAVEVSLIVLALFLACHVGTWLHERAHLAVARYHGLSASMQFSKGDWIPVYFGGECVIHPYSQIYDVDRIPTRVTRRISFAPVVVLAIGVGILAAVVHLDGLIPALPSSMLFVTSLVFIVSGLPSGGDVGLADEDARLVENIGRLHAIRRHGFAEGIETPTPAEIVSDTVRVSEGVS